MRMLWVLAAAMLVLVLAACGESEPTPAPVAGEGPATPDGQARQATIAALAQARGGGTPTPTIVPVEEREVVLDFAKRHGSITQRWDRFHVGFDEWREGLIACDATAVQSKLREFAGIFSGITEQARGLPRSAGLRASADKLIEAIETEERAIRQLRDSWRPDDPTVFEEVDIERSAALAVQNEVQDELGDLQQRTAASSRLEVAGYSLAVTQLDSAWDDFHAKFDDFRAREADLTPTETVLRLSQLIRDFTGIVTAVRNLPTSDFTRPVSEILAESVEEEELALRKLRGTPGKSDGGPEEPPPPPPGFREPPPQLRGERSTVVEGETTLTRRDLNLFDAFDVQLVASNGKRREARQKLAEVERQASEENEAAVTEFATQYTLLLQAWNQFHSQYDGWRRTEGGCDRSRTIETLGGFSLDFGELATSVRDLPRAIILRPLGELLVEAAEREEQALRLLRNTWRPFDADVYRSLDQQRNTAGKLRRQVASGIRDLLARHGVSEQELAQ